jgi:Helicase conserved C-terminal domain
MTSAEVREDLVGALELDLVGPEPGSLHESETLPIPPSRWYLTGYLVPFMAPESQRREVTADDELDLIGPTAGTDDDAPPERASARKVFFPSSIGLSVLVPSDTRSLRVIAQWGDYKLLQEPNGATGGQGNTGAGKSGQNWRRTQRAETIDVTLPAVTGKSSSKEVPNSNGVRIVTSVRTVRMARPEGNDSEPLLPEGTRAVAIFLVNYRPPAPDERKDEGLIFQTSLKIHADPPFVARPNLRGYDTNDWDERVADLQYRDVCEYAVGHGVATKASVSGDGQCHEIATEWMPATDVEKVEPALVPGVELSMEALAGTSSVQEMQQKLSGLVSGYTAWIGSQRGGLNLKGRRLEVADELLRRAEFSGRRIDDGIRTLEDPIVLEAFRIANRTMAAAARRRQAQIEGKQPSELAPPKWRPFQLAFLLLNLRGISEPAHANRDVVDLLFFPTGGGKTEAYLGLAAITLVLRRLRNPGVASAGVSVLMRYTLRLLTLDQLGRAAALICALELEREKDVTKLGQWPFEIGLWVGQAATPNRMGQKGDNNRESARAKTIAFKNDDKKPSPIPLETCPWCGEKFKTTSFNLVPTADNPTDLHIVCMNRNCDFKGDRHLPIVAIDEPLYRRIPCFLIATVDKFANLPWVGQCGALFGKVDRWDKGGFYGPCDPNRGNKLEKQLLPPDLIIQDELHLISGPLGTMVGLYETAIDELSSRAVDGRTIRPKVVASTATVRRAEVQIGALFARQSVEIFPPPGPNRRDSFFARIVPVTEIPGRRYLGIAAQGKSLKVVVLRAYLALLAAAQKAYEAAGGKKDATNPADPYMTLVGYFNSLRELGGSRRIVEDEVRSRLEGYGKRLRVGEQEGLFAKRTIGFDAIELTSRVKTNRVAEAKRRLALSFSSDGHVDVALASNMISVGLDITRLGLMVVLGQPKMTAEYIQATSRVGRDDNKPGLVVTLLNVHKARDRSHYERFETYHASFYRAVEATSVTPFSPRAIDRGLPAVTVSLARLGWEQLTAPLAAGAITAQRASLSFVPDTMTRRVDNFDRRMETNERQALRQKVRGQVQDLLDEWVKIAESNRKVGVGLQYQQEAGLAPPLLRDPLDQALPTLPPGQRKFKAGRSLRGVEPSVNLWVKQMNGLEVESPAEDE